MFISKRLNQRGHRFGFVRFSGILNLAVLEKQLDNIWIGNIKIHVNKQRYCRLENTSFGPNGKTKVE